MKSCWRVEAGVTEEVTVNSPRAAQRRFLQISGPRCSLADTLKRKSTLRRTDLHHLLPLSDMASGERENQAYKATVSSNRLLLPICLYECISIHTNYLQMH